MIYGADERRIRLATDGVGWYTLRGESGEDRRSNLPRTYSAKCKNAYIAAQCTTRVANGLPNAKVFISEDPVLRCRE